jgi:hypothetical protein
MYSSEIMGGTSPEFFGVLPSSQSGRRFPGTHSALRVLLAPPQERPDGREGIVVGRKGSPHHVSRGDGGTSFVVAQEGSALKSIIDDAIQGVAANSSNSEEGAPRMPRLRTKGAHMTSERIDGNKLWRRVMASMAAAVILVSASAALAASLSGPGTAAVVNGRVTIDGQPFFPFGFYHVTHAGTEANLYNSLNMVSSAGFNTLHAGHLYTIDCPGGGPCVGYGKFLDAAAQQGVRVITEFGNSSATLTHLINNYGGKAAVLGWNVADDVDDGTKTRDQVFALYNQVKTSDPRHLAYISGYRAPNEPGPGGVTSATFMDLTNLLGMQRYPINYGGPIRIVWHANASTIDAARPRGLPVIANLQAFNWNDSHGNRFPTPAEGRNMTYQAIAAGVKGIIYYTFFDRGNYLPTGSPSLWAELKTLVPEVNVLAPALLSGQMTRVLADASGDRFASYWVYANRVYVIVVNTSTSSAKTFSLPMPTGTLGPAQPLFSGRPSGMTFSNGVLSGTVQPLDVHAYVFNGSSAPLAPQGLRVQ